MKRKIVFTFFDSSEMGGVQALFIRLAKFLQNECDVFVLEASSHSCLREFLWRGKVTFIKFCFRRVVLPSDAVVYTHEQSKKIIKQKIIKLDFIYYF